VNFATKTAYVYVKPGSTLTLDACNKAFAGTHYSAVSISEDPAADAPAPDAKPAPDATRAKP